MFRIWVNEVQNAPYATWQQSFFGVRVYDGHARTCETCQTYEMYFRSKGQIVIPDAPVKQIKKNKKKLKD